MLKDEELRLLDKSRRIHEQLIDHIVKDKMPDDPEAQSVLIRALGSLDKNVISVTKLRVDSEANKTMADMKDTIASIILAHKTREHPVRDDDIPELPDSITRENKVDGETEQGVISVTYNEFMAKQTA